ncbi:MAG: CTP synthase (glutamine hydrolyzing) [Candidatus Diapherotrites archaeon]|nr:CTP synthase (glutamine hydrolyzing) [Candidatus Diapherotrites archaeon]
MRFIVVTGGVLSGLGKGIVTSSLGKILQSRGYKVAPIKFDGYLNVDAGTMNPFRHGEVFVLADGTECDMDLGNYERFLGVTMNYYNNPTGGKIFKLVLDKERRGEYLGVDVQFIPHVTGEIREWVKKVGRDSKADFVLIEVGGTVGDIENSYFIEAMRQLKLEDPMKTMFVHVTLVPELKVVGEQKTKPTQQSVRALQGIGVQPDFIVCRCDEPLGKTPRKKIALFCNVPEGHVISDHDCKSIYEVPFVLEKEHFGDMVLKAFGLKAKGKDLKEWRGLVHNILNPKKEVTIGITGKYTALHDSYVSIVEALTHAGAHEETKVKLKWIETTSLKDPAKALKGIDGIIVPGGFGSRGAEGKINCIKYARENNIPFLGLCFGFQLAVVEFARNVCGMKGANSSEIDPKTRYPVIDYLPEQFEVEGLGGTMRLGAHRITLKKGSQVSKIYGGKTKIVERFRHRYECNPKYVKTLEKHGLVFSGTNSRGDIMQFLELPDHLFFIATQAHPEFQSRLERPSPPFHEFLKAASRKH